jgi:hypothetical protein
MAASGSSGFVGILRFQVRDSAVVLQPKTPKPGSGTSTTTSDTKVTSLKVDLRSGQVAVCKLPALPEDAACVGGVAGLLKMEHGSVLVLITKAKRVREICLK